MTLTFTLGCTLDAKLFKEASEQLPPTTVLPEGAIDAGFVDQVLPTSLTKSVGHFGSVSASKYYFLQRDNNTKVVRKFVKVNGSTRTEYSLPDKVMAHKYAFSTAARIYYFSYEQDGPSSFATYLRALDKATFSEAYVKCAGNDIDVDPNNFKFWQEGAEGFYFKYEGTQQAAFTGRIFYIQGLSCADTGATGHSLYQASGKTYAIEANSIYRLTAGTPTLIRDGANRPVDSGMVEYQGDLYFRADVDATGSTDYRLNKLKAATDDSVEEILTETAADYPSQNTEPYTRDNIHYFYCVNANCLNNQDVFILDMSSKAASLMYGGATLITSGRVVPLEGVTNAALIERGNGGQYFDFISFADLMNAPNVIDTDVTIEHPAYDGLAQNQGFYFPQHGFINGHHIFSGFDKTIGKAVLKSLDIGTMALTDTLSSFKNPTSIRVRNGELFFLAENGEKMQLYRSDGTNGGTSAVTGVNTDNYRFSMDYDYSGRLVRRMMDVAVDGSDLYVFAASKEKVYLAELSNGGLVKYVEIPGALMSDYSSSILRVQNSQILIAMPAHMHTSFLDVGGKSQSKFQPPGVQIISYDGASFSYWLNSEWALPNLPGLYHTVGGQEFVAMSDSRVLTTLVSPILAAGTTPLRQIFSITKTTMTSLFNESSIARNSVGSSDKFVMSTAADTPANVGLFVYRSGVNLKITTTAEDPHDFRWDGDKVYFVAEDSSDGLQYVWMMNLALATPVASKVSGATTIGSAPQSAWAKKTWKVGSDTYMVLPAPNGNNSIYGDNKVNLWKVSGGVATRYSDDLIEEIMTASDGLYMIFQPISGPNAGKFAIRRQSQTESDETDFHDFMYYMKPSALGLTVSTPKRIFQVKKDMSLTEVGVTFSTMSETDFDTLFSSLITSYTPYHLSSFFNYSNVGSKIINWGFVDISAILRIVYRNLDGTNPTEMPFSDVSHEMPDFKNGVALNIGERPLSTSFFPIYSPQPNSLLFMGHTAYLSYQAIVFGENGLLDAAPP